MTRILLKTSVTLALALGFLSATAQNSPAQNVSPSAVPQSSSQTTVPTVGANGTKPGAPQAAGQNPAKPDSAKPDPPKADSTKPDFSKEAFVFERNYTRINEEDDGTGTREQTVEVQVLSEAGVKALAVLSFPYTSDNQAIEFDYIRVRKPDGTVVKTPDYNVQDMPAEVSRSAPLYSDIHEKRVAVKGLSVGDVLEYVVRVRVFKPEVPGHFWYEHWFIKKAIERDERLEISLPARKYVKVVSPQFKPEISEEGARRIYRWKHTNLAVLETDPDEIPRRIPPNPDVQMTTFASWEDVGRWYGELQKQPLQVTPAIQAKAAELTKGLTTDDEKIHAIYNFVSLKYHYIGLDFGIGRYQPHAADDVLDNNYGDCKDKHTLLAALLKAAGYDAWPALIHATRKLDPDMPSPAQFNHVITVLPRPGGKYTWLDTTPEVAPFGLLLITLRNKQALVIPINQPVTQPTNQPTNQPANQRPMLMTTPENPPEPSRQEFFMDGKLNGEGTFTGHAEQLYTSDSAVLMRSIFRSISQSQWRELLQRMSYGLNFGGEVSEVKVSSPEEIDQPFTISYDYVRKNYSDWENRQILAPLPPVGIEVMKGAKEKKPTEPVLLGAPGKVTYRSRMQLPEGYKTVAPEPVHLSEDYAGYDDSVKVEDGVMTITRELVTKKSEIPLSDWEGYRSFGREIADDEYNYMRFTRTGGTISKSIETVLIDGPDSVLASPDVERDKAKKGNTATDESKTSSRGDETAKSDRGTATAGNTPTNSTGGKEHNSKDDASKDSSLSEMFRDGYDAMQDRDFQRAQEIYEKLLARDPGYPGANLNLGLALASRNQLPDAFSHFRKEEEIFPENPRAYQISATYLMVTGRRDEAMEEWRKLLKVDPENRTASTTLGGLLYQAGKYGDAVQVLETAVKSAPDSPALQMQLGGSYLKTGEKEKAVASLRKAVEQKSDDPEMLNNVSYLLADNNTNLDLARQYGEKAIAQLDEKAKVPLVTQNLGARITQQYSMVWDTMGWVYFQQGDVKRAESLVRSAWLLGQHAVVGEHLGEIYEKEGKTKEAAHIYELALAAVGTVPVRGVGGPGHYSIAPPAGDPTQALAKEITARYQKLTGKKPDLNTMWRLPSGEWSKIPSQQLSEMRTVKFGKLPGVTGSAEFTILFTPGGVESVEYAGGDQSVKPLMDKIKAAHYQVEFPAGSQARIFRKGEASCYPTSGCMAVLIPTSKAVQTPEQQ